MTDAIRPQDLSLEQKVLLDVVVRIDENCKKKKYGKLHFEKLIFLLTKKYPDELEYLDYTFDAYAMGPYNEYVDEVLDSLKDLHLIEGFAKSMPLGKSLVETNVKSDAFLHTVDSGFQEILDFTNLITPNDLIYIVYQLYPEYAQKSSIKHRMKSDNFEVFNIPLEKLNERVTPERHKGSELLTNTEKSTYPETFEVTSDKGNKLKITISDGSVEMVD